MINYQRFWSKHLKNKVKMANEAIKTKNFTRIEEILEDLITLLKDTKNINWKDRVAICFILEQMAAVDPLMDNIVDGLMEVLENEKDPHVKEFAVWALGEIVEKAQSLELIKLTMPVIMKFLNDDSEQVRSFANDLHSRFKEVLKEKQEINEKISNQRDKLMSLIEGSLDDVEERSKNISKDALSLDYKTAHERQDEFRRRIAEFKQKNQELEDEILELDEQLIEEVGPFKGESLEIIRYWRKERAKKEDLIRRVECILRIQSKIWKIIQFITSLSPDENLKIDQIKEITKKTGRPYSEKEVIEILQKLVDEEIVPTFMLDQIKDYQIKAKEYAQSNGEGNREERDL